MTALFVAIGVEFAMIVLLVPIRLCATVHFSLKKELACVQLKLGGASLVRLVVTLSGGIKAQINGKTINKAPDIGAKAVNKLIAFAVENKILSIEDLIAYVGAKDAKNGAILCAIFEILPIFSKRIVQDCKGSRLDAECDVKIKINVLQAVKAAFISKGR